CYSVSLRPIFSEGGVKMDASEPRVRRRGFFLHSDTTGEPDTGEHENPEGFVVRVRNTPQAIPRHVTGSTRAPSGARIAGGRSHTDASADDTLPEIRSGSVTGSRQRADSP